jgi:hypothetical protein
MNRHDRRRDQALKRDLIHTAGQLARQFEVLIRKDGERTHQEVLTALMMAIEGTLGSIDCSGCRKLAGEYVKETMPKVVTESLKNAAERYGEAASEHIH